MLFRPQTEPDLFFFFNDAATTEIYTLSLHDALPISAADSVALVADPPVEDDRARVGEVGGRAAGEAEQPGQRLRSEEHTSELQSRQYLVCRLLLEKKNNARSGMPTST